MTRLDYIEGSGDGGEEKTMITNKYGGYAWILDMPGHANFAGEVDLELSARALLFREDTKSLLVGNYTTLQVCDASTKVYILQF